MQQLNVGTILAFLFSDGSVEFRDRTTLDILGTDQNNDQIASLPQIGFGFVDSRLCELLSVAGLVYLTGSS